MTITKTNDGNPEQNRIKQVRNLNGEGGGGDRGVNKNIETLRVNQSALCS